MRIVRLLAAVFLSTSFCSAQTLPLTFTNARDGFSISFPEGWAEVPHEKLDAVNRAAAQLRPDWKAPVLHYAYEMTNTNGLSLPVGAVVRVTKLDRPPIATEVIAEMSKKEELPVNFSSVTIDKPVFDVTSNVATTSFHADISGLPRLEGWAAYFLTEQSIIKLVFEAAESDHQQVAPVIQQIISNIRISEDIKLKPTPPPSPLRIVVVILSLAGMAVVVYFAKPAKSSASE